MGERGVDALGVHGLVPDAALAQAAQDLRRDDAGVAARAHEGARGDGLADLGAASADGQVRQVLDDGFQRQRHVRARVAVGHGEHVQAVDLVLALAQRLARGSYGVEQVVRGIGFWHGRSVSLSAVNPAPPRPPRGGPPAGAGLVSIRFSSRGYLRTLTPWTCTSTPSMGTRAYSFRANVTWSTRFCDTVLMFVPYSMTT